MQGERAGKAQYMGSRFALPLRRADARRALLWIRAKGQAGGFARRHQVSREDIRREALSQKLNANETTELLAGLYNLG